MKTKKLCFTAILAAIAILLNIFTISTGVKYFVISFTYIPCFIAGVFLGPFAGFSVGFIGDFLGCVIRPLGPWNPIISIASGLLGLIPAIIFRFTKMPNVFKIFLSYILVFVICTCGLNTYALFIMYSKGKTFWAYLAVRLPFQLIVVGINIAVTIFIMKPMRAVQKRFLPSLN